MYALGTKFHRSPSSYLDDPVAYLVDLTVLRAGLEAEEEYREKAQHEARTQQASSRLKQSQGIR